MASSLFGTSLLHRQAVAADAAAAADAAVAADAAAAVAADAAAAADVRASCRGEPTDEEQSSPAEPTDVEEETSPVEPVDVEEPPITEPIDVDESSEAEHDDDRGSAAATVAAAGSFALLVDVADQHEDVGRGEATEVLPSATAATTTVDVVEPTPTGVLYDAEHDARPWGRYVAIGLLVLVGVVALGVAAFLLLRTKSYEVPDLVGVEEAIALNEVSGNGWVVETERERSDEVPEIDHVVRTVPLAGEMLDEGATFVIVVSDGPELRTIPELAGVALAEAQEQLDELSLVLVEVGSEFSEDVPAGSVISWQVQGNASLVAGAQVLPGTIIEVTVSRGPEPRPAPDLADLTLEEATAALDDLQLVLVRGEDEFSNTVEVGRVVTQDPAPTTPVDRGGTVTVRISKGPDLVPFPDLAGQTYPQALESLEAAGYVENSLLGTTEGTFVSASIDGNEVGPGDTFPRGTGVDLIFL